VSLLARLSKPVKMEIAFKFYDVAKNGSTKEKLIICKIMNRANVKRLLECRARNFCSLVTGIILDKPLAFSTVEWIFLRNNCQTIPKFSSKNNIIPLPTRVLLLLQTKKDKM